VTSLRKATDDDIPAIVDIVEELDRFYGATDFDDVDNRRQFVANLLFGAAPVAYVLLAEDDDSVVAMATYSFLWPAEGITASVYLKELFVSPLHRRRGVGRDLIGAVSAIALESGCSRVEWTTDRGNLDAQMFYENIGAQVSQSKLMYRVDGATLAELAKSQGPRDGQPVT
jgi:GNAT superfamily N-acetyltransferase